MASVAPPGFEANFYKSRFPVQAVFSARSDGGSVFGALALLCDNASEAKACKIHIFPVLSSQGSAMICSADDGHGLAPTAAYNAFCAERRGLGAANRDPAVRYGDCFQLASMRIGADALLFTKCENTTASCILLSQAFHRANGLQNQAYIPTVSWDISQGHAVKMDEGFFDVNLQEILKVSPFGSVEELQQQFARIPGVDGNVVLCFNLHTITNSAGETVMELDCESRRADILLAGAASSTGVECSFAAYAARMVAKPTLGIYLDEQRVHPQHPFGSLYRLRKYTTVTKDLCSCEAEKANLVAQEISTLQARLSQEQERLHNFHATFRGPSSLRQEQMQRLSAGIAPLQMQISSLREEWNARKVRMETPQRICLLFGVNVLDRAQYGLALAVGGRLIKMCAKVGVHGVGHPDDPGAAGGVVCFLNLPADVVLPSLGKQELHSQKEHIALQTIVGQHLVQYWSWFRQVEGLQDPLAFERFWARLGYTRGSWQSKPSDANQCVEARRKLEVPQWMQCSTCLTWRRVADAGALEDGWTCAQNPDPAYNRCFRTDLALDSDMQCLEEIVDIPEGELEAAVVDNLALTLHAVLKARNKLLQEERERREAEEAERAAAADQAKRPRRNKDPRRKPSTEEGTAPDVPPDDEMGEDPAELPPVPAEGMEVDGQPEVQAGGSPEVKEENSGAALGTTTEWATPDVAARILEGFKMCVSHMLLPDGRLQPAQVAAMEAEALARIDVRRLARSSSDALVLLREQAIQRAEVQRSRRRNAQLALDTAQQQAHQLLRSLNGSHPVVGFDSSEKLLGALEALVSSTEDCLPAGWMRAE